MTVSDVAFVKRQGQTFKKLLYVAISLYAASDYESYLGHKAVLQMSSSSVTPPICHDKWKSDSSQDTGFVLPN